MKPPIDYPTLRGLSSNAHSRPRLSSAWVRARQRLRRLRSSAKYRWRVVRAMADRGWLWAALALCAIERWLRPPPAGRGRRILVIIFGGLGDGLLFDSMLRSLRRHWPDATIDVLTGSFAALWERMEPIDRILYYWRHTRKGPLKKFRLYRTLFRAGYDVAIEGLALTPQHGTWPMLSSLVLTATRATIRVGRPTTGRREFLRSHIHGFMGRDHPRIASTESGTASTPRNPILTHTIERDSPQQRSAHESKMVLDALGIPFYRAKHEPRLLANPSIDAWARGRLRREWAAEDALIVGMQHETTYALKGWPMKHSLRLIEMGIANQLRFVLLGLDDCHSQSIRKQFPARQVLDLCGQTSLHETISLISACDVFFSADTGLAHVAEALGVPTVVLFGPSNEHEFGPVNSGLHTMILPPAALPCRPCILGPCVRGESCMNLISPESAYTALQSRLELGRHERIRRELQPGSPKPPSVLMEM